MQVKGSPVFVKNKTPGMAENNQGAELELSGATHLLIRQLPATNESHFQISDMCGQPIPVLLQLAENPHEKSSDDISLEKNEDGQTCNITDEKPLAVSSLLEVSSLEDFMDVVTTYKCKFCSFSCAWKSGLMSHIRNTHLEVAVQKAPPSTSTSKQFPALPVQPVADSSPSNSAPSSATADENNSEVQLDGSASEIQMEAVTSTAQEKQIFLCGQCNQGFTSLDLCKAHMFRDHQVKVEAEEEPPKPKRRKQKPKRRVRMSESVSYSPQSEVNENEDGSKTAAKRRVRPPPALEEDYVLSRRRKRVHVESSSDRNFRCNVRGCGYRFKLETSLRYHERCHLPGGRNFTCPECNDKSDNWRYLSMHLWKVHQVDTDLHICTSCDYRTYSVFKLENHRRIHSEERGFVCHTCGKGFKQVSQLRNHCVIHMDRKNMAEKRWYSEQECDICNRTFSDSKCLRKHLQAVHKKHKPFVCSFCGHSSARKAMLQLHMRQHTGEKPFQCDVCEYRTGDHNSLRRHKMRHTGTKPYKCPHCAYACIQAISYKTHLKNKHPGLEGLFACTMCSFRSVSKENYVNHMADHKRGAIASTASVTEPSESPATTTISQIEGVLPNNLATAIYSCLNALSQEGGQADGQAENDRTQMITIQIPTNQELADAEQYYLTIQQPQDLVETNMDDNEQQSFTVTTAASIDAAQLHLAVSADSISMTDGLGNVQLVAAEDVKHAEAVAVPLVTNPAEN